MAKPLYYRYLTEDLIFLFYNADPKSVVVTDNTLCAGKKSLHDRY